MQEFLQKPLIFVFLHISKEIKYNKVTKSNNTETDGCLYIKIWSQKQSQNW